MASKLMKYSGLSMMALSLALWGCESVEDHALMGPAEESAVQIVKVSGDGFQSVRETDPEVGVVSAVIDGNGGSLNIGDHTLTIPKGAVDAPTTFVMHKEPGKIQFALTATRETLNDVGSRGFRKDLTLKVSYSKAANVAQDESDDQSDGKGARRDGKRRENGLQIVWLKSDGSVEVLNTRINRQGDEATAKLDHFSDYGLGWP